MIDIFINFLSATELPDGTLVHQPSVIARNYAKKWFIFDFVSVLPFQTLESVLVPDDLDTSNSSYNSLIRLVRLPRLYRMAKIVRLFKFVKVAKKMKFIQKVSRMLKMNAAILRMI